MAVDAAINVPSSPRVDDRQLCDLIDGVTACFGIAAALDVGIFRRLHRRPQTAGELREALGLNERPLEALLDLCVAAGLLEVERRTYSLGALAEEYLLEDSPFYAGAIFDLWTGGDPPIGFERMREALRVSRTFEPGRREWIDAMQRDAGRAEAFTRIMHAHSIGCAFVWPEHVDFGAKRAMLDVGGGSGAHSIGAVLRWPELRAIVLDLETVCRAASHYIAEWGLEGRIVTHAANMWTDPWPNADVHFFSDVLHNWTLGECRQLVGRSFDQLRRSGCIVIHEMLHRPGAEGSMTVAAASFAMSVLSAGRQLTEEELIRILDEAGFRDLAVTKTSGYWSIVVGSRP